MGQPLRDQYIPCTSLRAIKAAIDRANRYDLDKTSLRIQFVSEELRSVAKRLVYPDSCELLAVADTMLGLIGRVDGYGRDSPSSGFVPAAYAGSGGAAAGGSCGGP